MDLSIIIINYNTFKLTCQCIESVYAFTAGISFEIIVVDNASVECDPSDFLSLYPQIKLISNQTNLGFSKANNIGIDQASGSYIVLLNSDTFLKDNTFLKLYNYLEDHPAVGVVSPRLVFPDGTHQSAAQRFPSIKYSLIEFFRLQKLLTPRGSGKLLLGSFFDHKETIEVDWVWGTCFMFRKGILQQLPGNKLDDSYFMYCEDIQWCMDIKNVGYEIHFFADTEVAHLMGGSSGKKNALMEESGDLFLCRNYSEFQIKWIKRLQKLLST